MVSDDPRDAAILPADLVRLEAGEAKETPHGSLVVDGRSFAAELGVDVDAAKESVLAEALREAPARRHPVVRVRPAGKRARREDVAAGEPAAFRKRDAVELVRARRGNSHGRD